MAGTGTNATSSSGALTTTAPNALLVAANDVATGTSAAGSGFTSRVITNPNGDIVEDRLAATAGSYTGTAPLFSSGTWVMQMVAFRAGSGGPPPPDTQPPTAPGNLTATVTAATQIDLAWTIATDNIAVTNYLVERCVGSSYCTDYVQIGTATGTSFANTGLAFGTRYRYRVRATDAAGNLGPYSGDVSAITPVEDPEPPTAPSALEATAPPFVAGQINLAWTGSTDNVGVASYRIERCVGAGCGSFTEVATATGITFNDTGLAAGTSYSYRVRAVDANGNTSGYSNTASAATAAADTQAPTAPSGLTATLAPSGSQINLGVDRLHRQRRGDQLPRRALQRRRLLRFRGDRHCPGTDVQQHRARCRHQLQLPRSCSGRRREHRRLLQHGGRHHPGHGGHAAPTCREPTRSRRRRDDRGRSLPGAQNGGNLNVVIVGWNDSTRRSLRVVDIARKRLLAGRRAHGDGGSASQSIYYAKNIAAPGRQQHRDGHLHLGRELPRHPHPRVQRHRPAPPRWTSPSARQGTSATSEHAGAGHHPSPTDLLVAGNMTDRGHAGAGTGLHVADDHQSGRRHRGGSRRDRVGDVLGNRATALGAQMDDADGRVQGEGSRPPPPPAPPDTTPRRSQSPRRAAPEVSGTVNVDGHRVGPGGVLGAQLEMDGCPRACPISPAPIRSR